MDLLQEIERKLSSLVGHASSDGVQAATRHIKAAERYLLRARDERDEELFNDVIYRTNQAFEGMLKEAYSVLSDKDASRLTPNQIEQHLLAERVLAERVIELLTNYRQQWRNPSTHNHKLFFNEQEALLAIVSVSAFASILLDQIIGTISYKSEQKEVESKKDRITKVISARVTESTTDEVLLLLELFNDELKTTDSNLKSLREIEISGKLYGFINSLNPSLEVQQEPLLTPDKKLRPDLVLAKNNDLVIVEVKRPGYSAHNAEYAKEQMRTYLSYGTSKSGVIYFPPATAKDEMVVTRNEIQLGNAIAVIHIVAPKQA